jgi:hypothetical protein
MAETLSVMLRKTATDIVKQHLVNGILSRNCFITIQYKIALHISSGNTPILQIVAVLKTMGSDCCSTPETNPNLLAGGLSKTATLPLAPAL